MVSLGQLILTVFCQRQIGCFISDTKTIMSLIVPKRFIHLSVNDEGLLLLFHPQQPSLIDRQRAGRESKKRTRAP